MPLYLVHYTGFALVEADNEEEARTNYQDDYILEEETIEEIELREA